ncbi:MAG: hypothetical protein ABI047_15170 [Jatrophihabitantaceae bacterium]
MSATMTDSKTKFSRALIGIAAVGAVAVTATACSSSSKSDKPVADIKSLSGQTTAVKLDSGFTDALTALKLTPGVVGTAKLTDGSLVFPITGGNVTYYKPGSVNPFVQGIIHHADSGFSLSAGGTKVELTNFDIDPGASKLYGDVSANGASVVKHAYLFNLDGTTLKGLQTEGDTAILEGTKVEISPDAADLLGKTFNTDAVKAGLLVGIAKITVNTK